MKYIAGIFNVLFCCTLHASLSEEHLQLSLYSTHGVTNSGGRISDWTDNHNAINTINPDGVTNVFSQADANYRPYVTNDFAGYPCLMFPWAFGNDKPTNYLTCGNGLTGFATRNTTIYVVASVTQQNETSYLFHFSSWAFPIMGWAYVDGRPAGLIYANQISTTLHTPVNKAIYVLASGSSSIKAYINYDNQTLSATGSTTVNSGEIGGYSLGQRFSGIVYAILVYKTNHTSTTIEQNIAALANEFGVITNYPRQVVCRGDSLTAGVGVSRLESWPFQLYWRYPQWKVFNFGRGAVQIGTNTSPDNTTMFTADDTLIDPVFAASKDNILLIKAGINDLYAGGLTGEQAYARLTNYCSDRLAAHSWNIVVSTIAHNNVSGIESTNYNNAIRADPRNYWSSVSDPGCGGRESRLNNFADATYFVDGLHLTSVGYGVVRDYFQQYLNVQNRSTGFFFP